MIYRAAVLITVLLAVVPAYAAGHPFTGTCSKGDLAFSDGVPTGAVNGTMTRQTYQAMLKKQRAEHLTQGGDGFLWSKRPFQCDSIAIVRMDDYPGHTMVTFSNHDPNNPILGFAGGRINDDGPLFFSSTVYLADGKAMQVNPGSGQGCHFYFTDHGTFTQGWESRLTTIEYDLRMKGTDGHIVTANVTFDVSQPPPIPEPSRDPATSKPQ